MVVFLGRWSKPAKPKIWIKYFSLKKKIFFSLFLKKYFYKIHMFCMWYIWQNHNIFNVSDNGFTEGNLWRLHFQKDFCSFSDSFRSSINAFKSLVYTFILNGYK